MGTSQPKVEVTTYYMSIHFGIASGPLDSIKAIIGGEKVAWEGEISTLTEFNINKKNLFGGVKKEGGMYGQVFYLPGQADQLMPSRLASKFSRTPETMPAYRGVSTIFFTGLVGKIARGFLWGANSPYLKGVWIKCARAAKGLSDATARIYRPAAEVPTSTETVNIDAQDNAGTTNAAGLAAGVTIDASPGSVLRFTQPGGGEHVAWSPWGVPSPANAPGHTGSLNRFWVARDGVSSDATIFGAGTHDGYEAARAAFEPATHTGGSTYTFFFVDSPIDDNSGGVSIFVEHFPRDFDANPAHMIYESMTNADWGIGLSPLFIDLPNFEAAATTLYNEGFGLSMMWTRQTSVESFIQEILDHIDATLFLNPRTGLFTIKLIRDDYDIEDLKVFNPDNADIRNFKRKLFGETTNEIIVTWTNPVNEQEETVNVQDTANIAIQGGEIISDGRNYYGIRTRDLATRIGMRDLRVASAPLASCDIEVDRSAWDLLPGDCIVLVSPDDDIEQIVMRVGPIDYGRPGSPAIKVSLAEDIFSLEAAEYTVGDDTEWTDPREEPSPADFAYVFTLPYYLVAALIDTPETEYPTVYAGILAAEEGQDTNEFELYGTLVDGVGVEYEANLGTRTITSHAVLAAPLVAEADTTFVAWPEFTQGNGPVQAGFMIIGDGTEAEVEIALIASVADDGGTIYRGVLDTVPRAWAADTPIWFVAPLDFFHDAHERSAAELVEYKVLIQTSLGMLEPEDAPWASATLTERPHLPLRPANVTINGVAFSALVDAIDVDPIPVLWSERNRVTENTVVLAWDDATVTAEAGQTTRITVYDVDHNELTVHDALTGTDFDLPAASFTGNSRGWVKVESVRDDLVSLQGYEMLVEVAAGYGYGYGYNYGGVL